jgi:hypothetical protein
MFNVKDRDFNFQIFDYANDGASHYLLSHDDIKILAPNLDFICRIPIQVNEPYEKMAISSDHYLLMKNDFTLIGGEEWPEMHAPVMKLLLLNRNGEIISVHKVENAYGLSIELRNGCLCYIYSVFNDDNGGRGETEIRFVSADQHFNIIREHALYRDQCIMEFPVCEAVFDSYGRSVLFNTDGELFIWDLAGKLTSLIMDREDHLCLIHDFHKIRNLQFYSEESELVLNYSNGRVLRYSFCPIKGSLKLKMETGTGCENSHQFVLKEQSDDRIICTRRGKTTVYKRTNSVRFILFE